ncbi:MAG: histidinol-phosphate transaminase [Thermoproteus sp.]
MAFKRLPEFYEEPDVGYDVYRLHFNENLFLPEEYYREVLGGIESWEVRFYTQPNNASLAARIEDHMGLPRGSVVITAGADDGLRLAIQLLHFAEERRLVVLEPTYSMPRILAEQLGVEYVQLPYGPDLGLDVDTAVKIARGGAVYVCSPNNPTGHLVKELEELASRLEGLLIYDAAYAEFAGLWRPKLHEYGNVVEMRTFSKAWGLAGLRVGYLIARGRLASALRALAYPHPISSYSAKAVEKALGLEEYVRRSVLEMRAVRDEVAGRLRLDKYVGEANFITLRLDGAEAAAAELYRRGFAVRALGGRPLCRSCLRFTVAPMGVMEKFLAALGEALGIKLI